MTESPEWQWLALPAKRVRELAEHAGTCHEHEPTPEEMLQPRFLRADADRPPRGVRPPRHALALDRVPASLHLVVAHGMYLRSNGLDGSAPTPVSVPGCDPAVDSEWRQTLRRLAGVEEQVLGLPLPAVTEVLAECGQKVWLGVVLDDERFAIDGYGLAPEPEAS
ncbi:MAG: hypothetical protein R6V11_09095 [Ectothiorhodospiraceae bacterium]